jgi:hypothetical protein
MYYTKDGSKRRQVEAVVLELAEELVLYQFSYLDVSSLVLFPFTCRHWNRISIDWKLRPQADLTSLKLTTRRLRMFVKQRASRNLKVLLL